MIFTNACYSSICSLFLFIPFFPFFLLLSLIRKCLQPSLFSTLRWRSSETKIAALQKEQWGQKKFEGSFQWKKKYNTTCFSQENLKNRNDIITNSMLGEICFYCKICTKDVSCIYDIANDLVRHCNSVTHQKREKERRAHFSILKLT